RRCGDNGRSITGAAGRNRRYDPRVADADAEWGPDRRGDRLATDPAISRDSQLYAASDDMSGMWAHDQHVLPGNNEPDPDLSARPDAGMEADPPRCRDHESCGDGLHSKWAGRVQAFGHWDLAPGDVRGAEGAGVCRWAAHDDAQGRADCRGVYRDFER